jgi:hypothetical protein
MATRQTCLRIFAMKRIFGLSSLEKTRIEAQESLFKKVATIS